MDEKIITGSEQKTAKALKEIKRNQVTRTNHKGTPVTTKGPTSNKEVKKLEVKTNTETEQP